MNILITCFSRSWGGLELQALDQARGLQMRGHTVWLACLPDSRLEQEAREQDVRALPFDVTGYVHPRLVWRLGKFIARNYVDVVHCHVSKDIATVVPAVKLAMTRVAVVLTRAVGSFVSKKDPLHQFTYGNVDLVLAVSSVIHQNVLDTTPMHADRVMTFPPGIDTALFSPARAERQRVRHEFGFGSNITVIGFVGRFSPGKGHEELLRAAATVCKETPSARFVVVGEASYGEEEYEREIRALHHSLGLEETVLFAGFRRDIPDVMASFDLFAFPSHAEAFGLVLVEAMAMERPTVSTDCDGVVDIAVQGVTGLMVPPKQADALAQALLTLVRDPALRASMGTEGRKRVLDRFDGHRQVERLEQIYVELLAGELPSTGE